MEMVLEVVTPTLLRSLKVSSGAISSSYLFYMRACTEYYSHSVFSCIIDLCVTSIKRLSDETRRLSSLGGS